ncbi:MAG: tetratricopeptide repeat protein [Microthrixaceae bacterium]
MERTRTEARPVRPDSGAEGSTTVRRAAGWFAVTVLVALPLVFWPAAFGPFHAAKWLVACVAVPAGLAVCGFGGILRWPRWQWFVPLVAASGLSTVLGVAPWMSLLGSPNRNNGLVALALGIGSFVLGASVSGDGVVQRRLLRALMLTGGAVGALALLDRLGLDIGGLGDAAEATRARSTWGSATFAAAHLVIALPVAVAHLRSRDPRWRITAAACSLAMIAGLVATGTRAAWLASLFALVAMAPTWRATRPTAPTTDPGARRSSRTTLAIGALLLAAAVVVGALGSVDLGRSSAVGRLDLWSTVPTVVADRPLLGSGPDTQRVVLPSGIDEGFERDHGSEELHDRAHSLPLDTLLTTGILGLLALGALLVVLSRDVVANLRRELVPTAMAAGLMAYLVTLLFAFGDPAIDPIAWLLAGTLWVGVVDPPSRGTGAHAAPHGVGPPRWQRVAAGSCFASLAVLGLLWSGGEVVAETRLQAAMDALDSGDPASALAELDGASAAAPARLDLHQVAARIVTRLLTEGPDLEPSGSGADDPVSAALRGLDDAARIAGDRDPELLMDRAELLTAAGDPQAALDLYERILVLYPNSSRAHLGLGLAASETDDLGRAEQAWSIAADLAPGDTRALVNLGILAERRGDPDVAVEHFEAALEVDPSSSVARAAIERLEPPTPD